MWYKFQEKIERKDNQMNKTKKATLKNLFALVLSFAVLFVALPTMPVVAAHDVYPTYLIGLSADLEIDAVADIPIGQEAVIFLTFDEPRVFTSDHVYILTTIPVIGDNDARSTNARITSFIVDGNDIGGGGLPVRGGGGSLALEIARHGHDPFNIADLAPFSVLEIWVYVGNYPTGEEGDIDPNLPDIGNIDDVTPPVINDPQGDVNDGNDTNENEADDDENGIVGWIVAGVLALIGLILVIMGIKKARS